MQVLYYGMKNAQLQILYDRKVKKQEKAFLAKWQNRWNHESKQKIVDAFKNMNINVD